MKVTTRLYYGLIVASKAKIYIMFRLYMYVHVQFSSIYFIPKIDILNEMNFLDRT